MASRHNEGHYGTKNILTISCVQRSNDGRRRGLEGHRSSGDTIRDLVLKSTIQWREV